MALTGREKATIFLSILGAETSSRVLRYLPDELADLIAAGINHLPTPSPEALSEVLGEFQSYLALPESAPEMSLPQRPAAPARSYAFLMYERPQMTAFLISILPEEERNDALRSLPRERGIIEELLATMRKNHLRDKVEEKLKTVFSGKM
jgi:flagellar motor switch protein FliG